MKILAAQRLRDTLLSSTSPLSSIKDLVKSLNLWSCTLDTINGWDRLVLKGKDIPLGEFSIFHKNGLFGVDSPYHSELRLQDKDIKKLLKSFRQRVNYLHRKLGDKLPTAPVDMIDTISKESGVLNDFFRSLTKLSNKL